MELQPLTRERIEDFKAYCRTHRAEVDDSFLYEEDLKHFEPNGENPTYIAADSQGRIIAAVSLILDAYHTSGKKGRFRIFHSELEDAAAYQQLLDAALPHAEGLDKVYIFVPLVNAKLVELMESVRFTAERYSYLLVRETRDLPPFSLPEGYAIRSLRPGTDEESWCAIRNTAFAKLQGSETPITPDMVTKMLANSNYIEGGFKILFHHDKPVGVVKGVADEYDNAPIMNIGPFALLPEYQGRGLGRSLLRAILHFAREQSYDRTILCVNAENDRAKALYLQEGFYQADAAGCYKYDLALQGSVQKGE